MEMETGSSQKSQQNSSKARRRLNHFERVAEQYADRHRVQFHNFLNKKVTKFEHRTSLRKLIDVNKNLQESQIKCIELMGFGTLAKIQLDQLDKVMLRWLLDRYDPEYSCFNIETHCYFVGDKDVEGALGVPATSQNIILDTTCIEGLKKYENIFKVVDGRIDMATLSDKLKSCTSTDTEFKVMYLALLFGTVLFPSYTQNLPVHYLNPLAVVDCINDLNWAGLIRNTLNDGIKRWKNKEGTYMSGCLLFLQVFFLAIIRPENSRSVINLASERPFLAFLTKPRIRSLTTDMQINVPYWSAKASYFGFDEMSAPTNSMNKTKVRTIRPDVSGDGSIDEHEKNVMDSNVSPDDCVHDENVRDSNVSLDDFVHDENVLDSNVSPDDWVHEDLPSDQHRSLNKNDEVEDPHVKQQTQNVQGDFYLRTELSMLRARVSRIEKQTDYVCKDDELRNPHMTQQTLNAHDDFYRNQLSLLSARQLCMRKDYADERIIDMLHYCTSPVESCGQIYLPINDLHRHWFLAIIDLDAGHVFVCDTAPGGLREYRRKILDDVIIRMEDLIKKWKPDKYKIRDIKDEFKFEYPEWVPKQPNGYDCGLYVCLMMMCELGVEQIRDVNLVN